MNGIHPLNFNRNPKAINSFGSATREPSIYPVRETKQIDRIDNHVLHTLHHEHQMYPVTVIYPRSSSS